MQKIACALFCTLLSAGVPGAKPRPRRRYRERLEKPKPIAANQPLVYRYALPTANHVFFFWAKPADYQRAAQHIYHAPGQASFVELPVVTTGN
jgi:uncharacterized protein